MRVGSERLVLLLRGTCWIGAILDAAAAARMFLAERFVAPGVVVGAGFGYAMWTAGSLVLSWSALLVWASRDPVARRTVLLLTAFPALAGLLVAQGVAVQSGFRSSAAAMPMVAIESGLLVLFTIAYMLARQEVVRRGSQGAGRRTRS